MKLVIQPIERRADIIHFAIPMIVFALAQSRAAKVESQHGKSKTVQRLHRVKHDFVVQRPAKQRMRMANQRRMGCVLRAGIQQRLQPSGRTVEKKRSDR